MQHQLYIAAHVDDRDKKDEIAQQFYNDKINGQHKADVILGGRF